MRGSYAVAVLDHRTGTLLLARDPMGMHPLFYAHASDGDLLASASVDALAAAPGVSSALNVDMMVGHLARRWTDPGETFRQSVRRVRSGHVLVDSPGECLEEHRYWDPLPAGPGDWIGEDEMDHFDHLLDTAVSRCLGESGTGVFLSGGLDSVAVAMVAERLASAQGVPRPVALSLINPDPLHTEENIQRGVGRELGLEHVLVPMEDAVAGGAMLATVERAAGAPAPSVRPWAPLYTALGSHAREHGCDAILTGGGGDEALAVTPAVATDLLRHFDLAGFARMASSHRRSYERSTRDVARAFLWNVGMRPLMRQAARGAVERVAPAALERRRRKEARDGTAEWLAPDAALRGALEDRTIAAWPAPTRSAYAAAIRRGLDHPFGSQRLEEIWTESHGTGIPVSQPFMDPDLVQFLTRTPPELLNANGRTKGLVRGRLAERMPSLGFDRQRKIGETAQLREFARRELRHGWQAVGPPVALAELGVVEITAFERARDANLSASPDVPLAPFVADALTLEAWLRPRI
jgi:asparagine synthase (glutamine-hydrolysing)